MCDVRAEATSVLPVGPGGLRQVDPHWYSPNRSLSSTGDQQKIVSDRCACACACVLPKNAGRILVGLGAATEQEVQRNNHEANLIGVRTFKLKYAWISDRLKTERERGISTYKHLVGCQ